LSTNLVILTPWHYWRRWLAKVEVKKAVDTLGDVKALRLVDVFAYMLAGKEGKTHAVTPGEMWRLRHR